MLATFKAAYSRLPFVVRRPVYSLRKYAANIGVQRDPRTDKFCRDWRKLHNWCMMTGVQHDLQTHHVIPVHIDPSKQLDPTNVITLTEAAGIEAHLKDGHRGNWMDYDPDIKLKANSAGPGQPATLVTHSFAPPPVTTPEMRAEATLRSEGK